MAMAATTGTGSGRTGDSIAKAVVDSDGISKRMSNRDRGENGRSGGDGDNRECINGNSNGIGGDINGEQWWCGQNNSNHNNNSNGNSKRNDDGNRGAVAVMVAMAAEEAAQQRQRQEQREQQQQQLQQW